MWECPSTSSPPPSSLITRIVIIVGAQLVVGARDLNGQADYRRNSPTRLLGKNSILSSSRNSDSIRGQLQALPPL